MQIGNISVDDEVHERTLKCIGKKHRILWNHEGTLKYIRMKHHILRNIDKCRDSRNNTYQINTVKYISLNYHQAPSLRLNLSFLRMWAIWIYTWVEVVTSPIHRSCWGPDTLCSYCVCWCSNFLCQGHCSSVLVVDHYHPSHYHFLNEQVLINISEKVQFHVCHLKSSLPGKTRGSVIMNRIKTIMLEAHVPKILEHVNQ